MKKSSTLLLSLLFVVASFASTPPLPLPNGATAPNWTLTDENGVSHQLYDYLDQGYTVYIDFFATWCSICWNYKQSNHLKNLYEQYGPGGTNQVRVFAIEGDMSTPQAALYGGTGSQGNWVAGTPYPVIHASNNTVTSAYQVFSFPTVYAICPDRKAYNIGTAPLATLVNWIGSCSLAATGVVTNAACAGQANGAIDLSVTGGTGNISYLWTNGANTQDVNNLGVGSYSCTITEGLGRSITAGPFSVAAPQSIVAFGQAIQPSCAGADGILAVSANGGTAPYTYDAGAGPSPNPIISGLAAGTYNVTIADANGCEKVIAVNVPQETPPYVDAGPDQMITCAEPTVVLFGGNSDTGPNLVFQWFTPDGLIQNPQQINPTVAAPGTYILTLIDAATGCTVSDTAFVLADTNVPMIAILPPDALDCENTEINVSTINLGPCFEYEWTTLDGNIVVSNDNEIVVDAPGTYFLAVTNTCTGCTANSSVVVADASDLEAMVVDITDLLCATDSTGQASVMTTGGTAPYAFVWSSGQQEQTATDLKAGVYSVTVSDSGGCEQVVELEITAPDSIAFLLLDLQPASAAGAADGTLQYEVSGGIPPYQETWYKDGFIFPGFDAAALAPGIYELEVLDANGCFFFSERYTISIMSSVSEKGMLEGWRLWPNPATDRINLSWPEVFKGDVYIVLISSAGREVMRTLAPQQASGLSLGLGNLPAGAYAVLLYQEGRYWPTGGRFIID